MVQLDAFSAGHLQSCRALLVAAFAAGVDPTTLPGAINDHLAKRYMATSRKQVAAEKNPACPECGGIMIPVANTEGLPIMGCKKCRYSRIEGDS